MRAAREGGQDTPALRAAAGPPQPAACSHQQSPPGARLGALPGAPLPRPPGSPSRESSGRAASLRGPRCHPGTTPPGTACALAPPHDGLMQTPPAPPPRDPAPTAQVRTLHTRGARALLSGTSRGGGSQWGLSESWVSDRAVVFGGFSCARGSLKPVAGWLVRGQRP